MKTLRDLAESLRRLSAEIESEVNTATKAAVIAIVEDAIDNSPVDTSRLISNYQVGVGAPTAPVVAPHVPGRKGSTRAESKAETLARATAALASRPVGKPVFIRDAVPYIKYLPVMRSLPARAPLIARATLRRIFRRGR